MATWCVSQVLVLRRELAAAKLEVARLAGENDELSHVTRQLHRERVSMAQQLKQRNG